MKKRLLYICIYTVLGLGVLCGLYFLFRHFSAPIPLAFTLESFGDFFVHFFDNFLFYPLGWLLKFFCWTAGGSYFGGVILYTLLAFVPLQFLRNRQDDLSFKMQMIQPELDKIDAKYAAFDDEINRQRAQIEKMSLYRRYKIRGVGCLVSPFVSVFVPFVSFILFCRFPHTPVLVDSVRSELFGFDLFGRISGGPRQLVGFASFAFLYLLLCVFQKLIFGDSKKQVKRNSPFKKRFTRIAGLITIVVTPVFGVVSWINDNGAFFFLPQDLMRIVGYVGFGGSLLLLSLSAVLLVLDHREAHLDELAYRKEESTAKAETDDMMVLGVKVLTFVFPLGLVILLLLGRGAMPVYMTVMTLVTTAASMYREIRHVKARRAIRESAYVTISDFRLIHSALMEEYQHIDCSLAEIETAVESVDAEVRETALAALDTERLTTLLGRAEFWRAECYLEMTLDSERGGPTDQEMARSAYADRKEAQELRGQLACVRMALLREEASFAEEAAPEKAPASEMA